MTLQRFDRDKPDNVESDLGRILVTIDDLKLLRDTLLKHEDVSVGLEFMFTPNRIVEFDDLRSLPDPDSLKLLVTSSTFRMQLNNGEARVGGSPYARGVIEVWARDLKTSKFSRRVRKIIWMRIAITLVVLGIAAWSLANLIANPDAVTATSAALSTVVVALFGFGLTFLLNSRMARSHAVFFPGTREEFRKSDIEARRHRRQIGIAICAALLAATVAIGTALFSTK